MEPVIIGGPEVKTEDIFFSKEASKADVHQGQVFRCCWDIGVTLTAGGKVFPHLVPHLMGPQALRIELIREAFDGDLDLGYFRVV